MAEREAAARRALPRTGVMSIDGESLLLHACLARMEANLSRSLAEKRAKKSQTIVNGEDCREVTVRTNFGRPIDESLPSEDSSEEFVYRSDGAVAEAALVRMTQHAAAALRDLEKMRRENDALRESLAQRESAVVELQARLSTVEAQLRDRQDPEKLFEYYKEAWKEQHIKGQDMAAKSHEEKQHAIEAFLERRRQGNNSTQGVSMFRMMYDDAEKLLQQEFRRSDSDIEKMLVMFKPQPGSIAVETKSKKVKSKGGGKRDDIAAKIAVLQGMGATGPTSLAALTGISTTGVILNKEAFSNLPAAPASPNKEMDDDDMFSGDDDMQQEGFKEAKELSLTEKLDMEKLLPPPSSSSPGKDGGSSPVKAKQQWLESIKTMDLAAAQRVRLDEMNADVDECSLDFIQRTAAQKLKKERVRNAQPIKSASLVVTFNVAASMRTIAKLDDAGTLMYQLRNVFVESSTTFVNLVIDMPSTVGKTEVINEQAAKIHLSPVWYQMTLYDTPVVRVCQISGPAGGVESLREPFTRGLHLIELPLQDGSEGDAVSVARDANGDVVVQIKKRSTKLQASRRLPSNQSSVLTTADVSLAENALALDETDSSARFIGGARDFSQRESVVPMCTLRQHKGLVYFVATRFGKTDTWSSPIQSEQIRCYASSMIDACRPDAIIMPFEDMRTPFFMTEDGPQQTVTISFAHAMVVPDGYSIASVHPIGGGLYPRSWKLEGSLDQKKWILLREHINDETLNRFSPTSFWHIPRVQRKEQHFQHFRLTQTAANSHGTHQFCVSAFEVYGRIIFVEKLTVESAASLPKTKVERTGFKTFSALPPPKVVDVAKKKK